MSDAQVVTVAICVNCGACANAVHERLRHPLAKMFECGKHDPLMIRVEIKDRPPADENGWWEVPR